MDLEHPEKVGVADRAELKNWKVKRSPVLRRFLFYVMLALIPVVVFGLMLIMARAEMAGFVAQALLPARFCELYTLWLLGLTAITKTAQAKSARSATRVLA